MGGEGGNATGAATRLAWLSGSNCAPSAQRCLPAEQPRGGHQHPAPWEVHLGQSPPGSLQPRPARKRREEAGQGAARAKTPQAGALLGGWGVGLPNAERTPRLLSLLGTKHLCAEALPPAPVKLCNRQGETLKIRKNTPMRPPPRSAARSQPMAGFGGLMGLS